ncbi:MAG TPA: DUF6152 family protein [Steroidobacteraceae bacterium]|jgi:hypothetical protein
MGVMVLTFSQTVVAHHSGAMFDMQMNITLQGTVKSFEWINPHCWIQVMVPAPPGATIEWSIEMGSVAELYRSGLRHSTFKPGDKLSVTIHPTRDGTHGGLFASALTAGGVRLGGAAAQATSP